MNLKKKKKKNKKPERTKGKVAGDDLRKFIETKLYNRIK